MKKEDSGSEGEPGTFEKTKLCKEFPSRRYNYIKRGLYIILSRG